MSKQARGLPLILVLMAVVILREAPATACEHPYPCGGEWPAGLAGPFESGPIEHVSVSSHDGTMLDGYIVRPALPDGVHAPAILYSTPYIGTCPFDLLAGPPECAPSADEWLSVSAPAQVAPLDLVRAGYAVALFSLRGTGGSGGCFGFAGRDEQQDQGALIDWLSAREWSNGRVGMVGLSYQALTAMEAAVVHPDALKTVVAAGMFSDVYLMSTTPQGARTALAAMYDPTYSAGVSLLPPVNGNVDGYAQHLPERACPEVVKTMTESTTGMVADVRDEAFFDDRRLIDRFDEVDASVLIAHGFGDYGPAAMQESAAWGALVNAPKQQIEGPWGHTFPHAVSLDPSWGHSTWSSLLLTWLDFWLKGIGPAPERLGTVDYQVGGVWRSSPAWPPAEARDEVLYLAGAGLSSTPGTGARAFRSIYSPADAFVTSRSFGLPAALWASLCPQADLPVKTGLVYLSEPLAQPAVIAGNPFAYLKLSSDLPGGVVAMTVFTLGPDFACAPDPQGTIRVPSWGGVDLRFHTGNFVGTDFPVDTPTDVRVDLVDLARAPEQGTRIGVFVYHSEVPFEYAGQPYFPEITVHPGSHIVLPFIEGTLGGSAASIAYPPRPFVP